MVTEIFPSQVVQINVSELGEQFEPPLSISAGGGKTYVFVQNQFNTLLAASKVPLASMLLTAAWCYTQIKSLTQTICYEVFNYGGGVKNFFDVGQEEDDLERGLKSKMKSSVLLRDFHSLTAEEAREITFAQTGLLCQAKKKLLAFKLEGLLKSLNPASITQEINKHALQAERSGQVRNFLWSLHEANSIIQSHASSVKNFCTKWPLIQHNADFSALAQLISIIPPLQEERLAIWIALKPVLEELDQLGRSGKVEEVIRLAEEIRPQLERSNQLSATIHAQIVAIINTLPAALTLSKGKYLEYTQAIGNMLLAQPISALQQQNGPGGQKWIYTQITEQVSAFFNQQGLESRYAEHFTGMLKGWVQELSLRQKTASILNLKNRENLQEYAAGHFDHYIKKTDMGEIIIRTGYIQSELQVMKDDMESRHPIVPTKVLSGSSISAQTEPLGDAG